METLESPQTAPPAPQTAAPPTEQAAPRGEKSLFARIDKLDWLIIGCILALFGPMFREMIALWTIPDAPQSYGLLVLPASLALVWMMRSRLEVLTPKPAAWGMGLVALGLAMHLIGTLAVAITASGLGFFFVITGIVITRYGTEIARRLWFPLAYLLAMVPAPTEILNLMTFPLQRISIHWAALILKPFTEVSVEGTQLHLGSFTLSVIAPCSGLTILLPLVVLAVYYLYMVNAPAWKKLLLAVLTVPMAMVVNAFRVALIGMVGESFGQRSADTFHDYSGVLSVLLGFGALYLLAREMKCHQISDDIML